VPVVGITQDDPSVTSVGEEAPPYWGERSRGPLTWYDAKTPTCVGRTLAETVDPI
jgi:hypothetical protein